MQKEEKYFSDSGNPVTQVLYFGKKRYRNVKGLISKLIHDMGEAWPSLEEPVKNEVEDKNRKLLIDMAQIGPVFLQRIREAEEYRASLKFRNCHYKKFVDQKNKKIIFVLTFYSLSKKCDRVNYDVISTKEKTERGFPAELITDREIEVSGDLVEEGKFRYVQNSLYKFTMFMSPTNGKKYKYSYFDYGGPPYFARFY
jgi:hypothetical protein